MIAVGLTIDTEGGGGEGPADRQRKFIEKPAAGVGEGKGTERAYASITTIPADAAEFWNDSCCEENQPPLFRKKKKIQHYHKSIPDLRAHARPRHDHKNAVSFAVKLGGGGITMRT